MENIKIIILSMISLVMVLNLVSAYTPYNDCNIYGNCKPLSVTSSSTNYSLVNVNNSQYLQSLTPQQVANLYVETGAGTGNCPSGQVVQNTTTGGVQCVTPSGGTTTSPIQSNGFVFINESENQVSNNLTTFINGNGTAFGKRVQNGTNGFQIVLPPTFTASGLTDYTNVAYFATCTAGQTCRYTKDFSAGDLVSCNAGITKARVMNVVNDTYFTTADNNLGYCAGTSKTLTIYKGFSVDLSTGKSTTTGRGAFMIDADGSEIHSGNIQIPNGGTFSGAGNVNIDSIAGSTNIHGNSILGIIINTAGKIAISQNELFFGSDSAGGAVGSLKTEGVIRGSTNGGTTNGGGTPLKIQANSIGNNGLAYIKMSLGYPVASGTGVQPLVDVVTVTYNNIAINATMNFTTSITQNDLVGIKNLQVNGNGTYNSYYGSMYNFSDTGWDIGIVTSGVYYNLTVSTAGEMNGFRLIKDGATGTKLQALVGGYYSIDGILSGEFAGGEYGVGLVTNGADPEVIGRCYSRINLNAETSVPITCMKRLSAGDNITMVIDDESTPPKDVKVHNINIKAFRIGN